MLSIITPNLNNAQYLEDNILSIRKLSIPFEHIVVDGGSSDGSIELLSKYPHVKVLHQTERTGMYGAIHLGLTAASGNIITWVNSDDRIQTDGYEKMYKTALDKNADLVYSDGTYDYVKEDKKVKRKGRKFGKFFLRHGCIPTMQPSIIFSKRIYDKVGGFDFKNFKICGDLDLFVKIAKDNGSVFAYVPAPSSTFMKRGDSLGDLNNDRYLQELKENKLPTPNPLIRVLFFICKYL